MRLVQDARFILKGSASAGPVSISTRDELAPDKSSSTLGSGAVPFFQGSDHEIGINLEAWLLGSYKRASLAILVSIWAAPLACLAFASISEIVGPL